MMSKQKNNNGSEYERRSEELASVTESNQYDSNDDDSARKPGAVSVSTPPSGSSTMATASKSRDWNERERMELATSSVCNEQKNNNVTRGKVSKGEDNRSNEDTKNSNRYVKSLQ
jgi:hypothetical protein